MHKCTRVKLTLHDQVGVWLKITLDNLLTILSYVQPKPIY